MSPSLVPDPSPWDSSHSSSEPESECPSQHSHTAEEAKVIRHKTSVRRYKKHSRTSTKKNTDTPWHSVWGSNTGWECWCRTTASAGCWPPWRGAPPSCMHHHRYKESLQHKAGHAPIGSKTKIYFLSTLRVDNMTKRNFRVSKPLSPRTWRPGAWPWSQRAAASPSVWGFWTGSGLSF